MAIKIILLLTLFSYSFLVSQSFMYILSLKKVQISLEAPAYLVIRKLIDSSMRSTFRYVIYGALLTNLLLVFSTINHPNSLLFSTAVIAFVALTVDTLLTVKGSLPINDQMNTWTVDSIPADWKAYQTKWFTLFRYRQISNIIGFLSLLIGVVFGMK